MAEILFVLTGARHWMLKDGHRHPTGYWAEEFTAPCTVLTDAGHRITVPVCLCVEDRGGIVK
ncbi:hypothetical protein [Streptomyces tremellae]|uniref:Uncharacterized protein n=1 Tax=Streptomyces tremellae TaxID=1124239 RepID=A0ABP7E1Y4_9ACTN